VDRSDPGSTKMESLQENLDGRDKKER